MWLQGAAAFLLLTQVSAASALPTPTPALDYASLLSTDRSDEGWVARTRRETRTFPYIEHARRLIAQGNLEGARKDLEIYLEREPNDLEARFTYGVLLQQLGDQAAAANEMTDILAARPGFGPAALNRAIARQKMGDERAALQDFETAAQSDVLKPADHSFALESVAEVASNLGETKRALRAFDELGDTPAKPGLELLHASLLAKDGRETEAIALLQKIAASGAPEADRLDALSRLSVLELGRGNPQAARAAAEQAHALAPKDPSLLDRLAEIATQQGDDRAAVAYRQQAVALGGTAERQRALSVNEERAGETSAAIASTRELLEDEQAGTAQTQQDTIRLAVLESQQGDALAAADLFHQAYQAGPDRSPDLLVRAAREYRKGGRTAKAKELLTVVSREQSAPPQLRADALVELADLDLGAKQDRDARRAFNQALGLGRDTWAVRQAIGDVDLRLGDPRGALDSFRAAERRRADPRSSLGAGYAYQQLGEPGLAIYEIDRALAHGNELSSASRLGALRTVGYLHMELGEYGLATEAWSQAEAIETDPVVALRLARAQRLSGRPLAAAHTLDSLQVAKLGTVDQALYWSERGELAAATGDPQQAEADFRKAIELDENPDRLERLGNLLAEENRPAEAEPLLSRALDEGGFTATRAAALGHVYRDLGDPERASALFARALEADPDILSLYEDSGYTLLEDERNKEAVVRFEEAIDNEPLYTTRTEKERRALERRMDRLRREVTEVERTLSFVAYTSICFGDSHCRLGETALVEGASESQGGMELAYRPPVIGFRNGLIFELISRLLYQQETNSIEPIWNSTVVTLGARYKPLRTQDLYLSVERIFGVGSNTTNNVLLRASYGWLRGYRMQPGVPHWSYTTVYLDVSGTVESQRNFFFYGEARQGITFNHGDQAMLTPLVYARTRNLTGDGDDYNDLDIGVGVSMRWLFNDDRYHDYRSSFELLPRIGYDAYNSDGRGWNIFLTGVVAF